jgi:hypothetical protein
MADLDRLAQADWASHAALTMEHRTDHTLYHSRRPHAGCENSQRTNETAIDPTTGDFASPRRCRCEDCHQVRRCYRGGTPQAPRWLCEVCYWEADENGNLI